MTLTFNSDHMPLTSNYYVKHRISNQLFQPFINSNNMDIIAHANGHTFIYIFLHYLTLKLTFDLEDDLETQKNITTEFARQN